MRWKHAALASAACFVLGVWCGRGLMRENAVATPLMTATAHAEETPPQPPKRPASVTAEIAAAGRSADQTIGFPLRIICIGAHPDDCEIKVGGVAALWAAQGHRVKFVAMTNGDIGHWREAGGPLARRRHAEVQHAAEILGVTTEVLDNHDGELLPTLENRRAVTRLIREWEADLVIAPRHNDYHPDHRYTGVLVQDAAYMVAVPFFCPDTPPLKRNPVFCYFPDQFQKPNPFRADVAIGIDAVSDKKLAALVGMESQFVEGGALGSAELIEGGEPQLEKRRGIVRDAFHKRDRELADRCRQQLSERYGTEAARQITFAEAFELCEYGRQPTEAELRALFPFFPKP